MTATGIIGTRKTLQTPITQIDATALYRVGEEVEVFDDTYGLRRFRYTQADDAISANQALTEDIAAAAAGTKVTPLGTAGLSLAGVSEWAVTDEYYFWMGIRGKFVVNQKTGIAVGDVLTGSATAGALTKAAEADSAAAYKNAQAYALVANSSGSDAAGLAKINCA